MPPCCRCNGSGKCLNCSCVKSGHPCTDCLPLRRGTCANQQCVSDVALSANTIVAVDLAPHASVAGDRVGAVSENMGTVKPVRGGDGGGEGTGWEGLEVGSPFVDNSAQLVESETISVHTDHDDSVNNIHENISVTNGENTDSTCENCVCPNYSLPGFEQSPETTFQWGEYNGADFACDINEIYSEAVHWRRNIFMIPSGKVGKDYVREQARLFSAYAEKSALERVSLKAALVMPLLLLQKPHPKSKTKEHAQCLERRLKLWFLGSMKELAHECRTIQRHLAPRRLNGTQQDQRLARSFSQLMFRGKVRAAMRLISDQSSAGVLNLDEEIDGTSVRDILKEKHPQPQVPRPSALLLPVTNGSDIHPVLFDRITGDLIRSTALRVQGSAGPSGMDAAGWRRMCTAFNTASQDLCNALAAVARRISTTFLDPSGLSAFIACRLIPFNKNPGVRPIGICEVVRRIIGKAVLQVTKSDIQSAVGPLQLCAGHIAGCESAVHAMRQIFEHEESEAVLLYALVLHLFW